MKKKIWKAREVTIVLFILLQTFITVPAAVPAGAAGLKQKEMAQEEVTPVWRVLWLHAGTISYKGKESCMKEEDYAKSLEMAERFERFVEESVGGAVDLEVTVRDLEETVTSLSRINDSYWIAPEDAWQVLEREDDFYDSIIVLARMDPSWGHDYWGLGIGPSVKCGGAGYSFVKFLDWDKDYWYLTESRWNPHPEQIYVHEWLHQVEQFYRGLGYDVPLCHQGSRYGYGAGTAGSHNDWRYFRDILGNAVYDEEGKRFRGIPAEAWQKSPGQKRPEEPVAESKNSINSTDSDILRIQKKNKIVYTYQMSIHFHRCQ